LIRHRKSQCGGLAAAVFAAFFVISEGAGSTIENCYSRAGLETWHEDYRRGKIQKDGSVCDKNDPRMALEKEVKLLWSTIDK